MRSFTILAAVLLPTVAGAQTFPSTATPFALTDAPYSQTFNSLAASGATGSALPPGFQVSETGSNANSSYGVGNGGSNAGNSYSFGATGSTDRALGSLASGSVTQVLFGGVFTNAAGGTIIDLAFAYTGEQWRLSNSTDDGLTFQYQLGATSVTGGTWTTFSSLGFTPLFANGTAGGTALNGNLAANQRALSGTIGGLSLLAGQNFGFRWVDLNSSATDQGLGVDNLSITPTLAPVAGAVPEPAAWAMMLAGFGLVGAATRRRRRPLLLA